MITELVLKQELMLLLGSFLKSKQVTVLIVDACYSSVGDHLGGYRYRDISI